jgi:hypothetical protein
MKRNVVFIVLIAALLLAIPVAAAPRAPTGTRIDILAGGPTSLPAGDPFHLRHGWLLEIPGDGPRGLYDFALEVDGVLIEPDFSTTSSDASGNLIWLNVYNFPAGMSGTHSFTGHWYGPCQYVALDPGTCAKKNAVVEAYSSTLNVSFP